MTAPATKSQRFEAQLSIWLIGIGVALTALGWFMAGTLYGFGWLSILAPLLVGIGLVMWMRRWNKSVMWTTMASIAVVLLYVGYLYLIVIIATRGLANSGY